MQRTQSSWLCSVIVKRVFKVLGVIPLNFDFTLINIFVDMIHQHWVAASLFLVSVVHGVANQGHEEITGGASNETGDFYFWLPFVIFFQAVRRQWVHRLVHKWDHQWQVFPSEVFLSSDLMPFKEMLPIINPLLQLLLMELVIFHLDSQWTYLWRKARGWS